MKTSLFFAVAAAAAFLPACTGGAITDANDTLKTGSGNSDLVVNFQYASNGQTYSTGVDSNGYFGFDAYAPATSTNNPDVLPVGTYNVWLASKSTGVIRNTTYTVNHQSNNASCPDHYVSGQVDSSCALYQLKLLGGDVLPPAPYPSSYVGYATTVVPLSALPWCRQAAASFDVVNYSTRYNDISFQLSPTPGITWAWKVTSDNLHASGVVPQTAQGNYPANYVDIGDGTHFNAGPYALYPNTTYTVSFYAGGTSSPCAPISLHYTTKFDTVPQCVIDHNCPFDPGNGDGGGDQGGSCGPGISCCGSGFCSDPGDGCGKKEICF
jgi:hypothetical protein